MIIDHSQEEALLSLGHNRIKVHSLGKKKKRIQTIPLPWLLDAEMKGSWGRVWSGLKPRQAHQAGSWAGLLSAGDGQASLSGGSDVAPESASRSLGMMTGLRCPVSSPIVYGFFFFGIKACLVWMQILFLFCVKGLR